MKPPPYVDPFAFPRDAYHSEYEALKIIMYLQCAICVPMVWLDVCLQALSACVGSMCLFDVYHVSVNLVFVFVQSLTPVLSTNCNATGAKSERNCFVDVCFALFDAVRSFYFSHGLPADETA
jgi:hypothetical protein